ncbi:heavy-metal-associated domain-containing protein [Mucilaginibacter sp.]|uniref:heavy-metal-associated domain-containing protein n=1 Tax=Mucilaginibacter sp. TaxID=1882438 RepID=UPI0025DC035E|nr:heavy-metal-associated domain-containing protein [Mucilaginibacter sp.]
MKTLKIFLVLLILTTGVARAQFTKAELQVSGLTCALCAKTTERSLQKLPFISEIKTDLIRNTYLITFKTGEQVNFDQISKSVKDAGFFVSTLKATFDFTNVKVADNRFTYGGDSFELMNAAKSPEGQVAVTIVDKGFAPKSVSKKYLGTLADAGKSSTGGRTYHLAM